LYHVELEHCSLRKDTGNRVKVIIQQGVPRGLQGPLAGRGVFSPFSSTPSAEAVKEIADLNSYARKYSNIMVKAVLKILLQEEKRKVS